MRVSSASSGISRAWLVIIVVVAAYLGFALVRVIPQWFDHHELEERVEGVLRLYDTQPPSYGPAGARKDVLRWAKKIGIPLREQDVQITDTGQWLRARVRYERPLGVPGLPSRLSYHIDKKHSGR